MHILISVFICSGTGALAIFLRRSFQLDITTSDYADQEIEDNIAHNCKVNGITPVLPHVKREFCLFFLWPRFRTSNILHIMEMVRKFRARL